MQNAICSFLFFFAMVLLVAINGIMAGLGKTKTQTKTTVEAQRKELAGVILGVLSDAAVSESGLFALWSQCGWRARDCLASAGQLPWIYGSGRSASQSERARGSVCVSQRLCSFRPCSRGFASPRLELLHNIEPRYDDISHCKSPTAPPPVFHFAAVHSVTAFPVSSRGGKNSGKRMSVLQKSPNAVSSKNPITRWLSFKLYNTMTQGAGQTCSGRKWEAGRSAGTHLRLVISPDTDSCSLSAGVLEQSFREAVRQQ